MASFIVLSYLAERMCMRLTKINSLSCSPDVTLRPTTFFTVQYTTPDED